MIKVIPGYQLSFIEGRGVHICNIPITDCNRHISVLLAACSMKELTAKSSYFGVLLALGNCCIYHMSLSHGAASKSCCSTWPKLSLCQGPNSG